MEIFPFDGKELSFVDGWSYLCFRHFYMERLRRFVLRTFKRDGIYLAYGRAETADEYLDRKREDEFLYEEAEQEYLAELARAEAEAEAEAKALDTDRREQEVCDGEHRYGDR